MPPPRWAGSTSTIAIHAIESGAGSGYRGPASRSVEQARRLGDVRARDARRHTRTVATEPITTPGIVDGHRRTVRREPEELLPVPRHLVPVTQPAEAQTRVDIVWGHAAENHRSRCVHADRLPPDKSGGYTLERVAFALSVRLRFARRIECPRCLPQRRDGRPPSPTTPSSTICSARRAPAAIDAMRQLEGDLIVLGVAGKMGPTLARMARRASDAAGVTRRVIGVVAFHRSGA